MVEDPLEVELEYPPKTRVEACYRCVRDAWRSFWLGRSLPKSEDDYDDWDPPVIFVIGALLDDD